MVSVIDTPYLSRELEAQVLNQVRVDAGAPGFAIMSVDRLRNRLTIPTA
jgi:hypothetical protein